MITFENPGLENTEQTLKIAVEYAKEHDCDIVVATSSGDTALKLKEAADAADARHAPSIVLPLLKYNSATTPKNGGCLLYIYNVSFHPDNFLKSPQRYNLKIKKRGCPKGHPPYIIYSKDYFLGAFLRTSTTKSHHLPTESISHLSSGE